MASFNTSASNDCFSNVSSDTIVYIVFAAIRILSVIFTIVFSYTHVAKDHFRTYTLFACTCLLPWDSLLIVWKLLAIAKANSCAVAAYAIVSDKVKPFMQLAVTYELEIDMLYMMIAVSCAYMRPAMFQRHFAKRKVFIDFIVSRLLSAVYALPTTLFKGCLSEEIFMTLISLQSAVDHVLAIGSCILTLGVAIAMMMHKTGTNHYAGRRHFLISFIIYCTPLLILNIPKLLTAIFLYLVKPAVHNWSDFVPPLRAINKFNFTIEQYRSSLVVLSTFLALSPYRRALLGVLHGYLDKLRAKKASTTLTSALSQTTHPATDKGALFVHRIPYKQKIEHPF